jgi:2-polyprenyl-3-methyl-5-hydroxy-6-metoxy-1,4-benzoquinol methylase
LEDLDSPESRDPFHIARSLKLDPKKQATRDHFDACAGRRAYWEQKAGAYYEDQARYYKFLIPEGLRVLEIGSGLGNLLAAVKPFRGVGIDLSPEMVKEAARRHPTLEFRVGDVETLDLDENFDVIILADVVGHLLDVEAALKRLRHVCTPIEGLSANKEKLQSNIENSPVIVTLLTPKIGYLKSAELFKESLKTGKTIRELVTSKKLMSNKEIDALFR